MANQGGVPMPITSEFPSVATKQDPRLLPLLRFAGPERVMPTETEIRKAESVFKPFFLRHVRCQATADKLFQDLLVNVFKYRNNYQPQRERWPGAWLWAIARNAVRRWRRQQARCSQVSLDLADLATLMPREKEEVGPLESAERAETTCVVNQFLSSDLPEDVRDCLDKLRGLTQTQIAERRGMTRGGASARIHRALPKLRAIARDRGLDRLL